MMMMFSTYPQPLLLLLLSLVKWESSRFAVENPTTEGAPTMKFTPGPTIAAASGSIGGTVYSHNRGGMYTRNRSIPITSTTTFALNAKSRLATASAAWQDLTDAQRAAWLSWALQNPVTDTLGFPRHLTGHQSYVALNTRLALDSQSAISTPPIVSAPDGLLTIVQDGDEGAGDVDLTFTATPLGATEKLWMQAAVTNSAGITNVNNLYRFIGTSAAAETSPYDNEAQIETRLGTLIVGQKLHMKASVFDTATGLLSLPLATTVVITTS